MNVKNVQMVIFMMGTDTHPVRIVAWRRPPCRLQAVRVNLTVRMEALL